MDDISGVLSVAVDAEAMLGAVGKILKDKIVQRQVL